MRYDDFRRSDDIDDRRDDGGGGGGGGFGLPMGGGGLGIGTSSCSVWSVMPSASIRAS
jgi:predicted metalloprotease